MNEIDLKKRISDTTAQIASSLAAFGNNLFTSIAQDMKCLNGEADTKTQEMVTKMLEAINQYIDGTIDESKANTLVQRYKMAAINYAEANKLKEMVAASNRIGSIISTIIDIIKVIVVK